ncbi:hypothetical protein GWI33_021599, partial [Rhynchophorus ferrugineus]
PQAKKFPELNAEKASIPTFHPRRKKLFLIPQPEQSDSRPPPPRRRPPPSGSGRLKFASSYSSIKSDASGRPTSSSHK